MKTRESIEAAKTATDCTPASNRKGRAGAADHLAKWQWKPGQSGNPGGRKNDMAQEIARAVFEKNPELIYQAFSKALAKGGAFAYQVLADRAYGKLKETREIGLEYNDLTPEQLQEEIERLMSKLGLARQADDAAEAGIASARASEQSSTAEDTHVLPGNGTVKTGTVS